MRSIEIGWLNVKALGAEHVSRPDLGVACNFDAVELHEILLAVPTSSMADFL